MKTVTLLHGHPFFEHARPSVWRQSWDGRWTVRWRDFHTIKCDATFDTEAEAMAFAKTLNNPPYTVEDDGAWGEDAIADADKFWRSL